MRIKTHPGTQRVALQRNQAVSLDAAPGTIVRALEGTIWLTQEALASDRILVAGACDWGPSEPIAVPKFVMEMRRRNHSQAFIQRVVLENPIRFLSQSPKFKVPAGAEEASATSIG